jgi:hypothetical protein
MNKDAIAKLQFDKFVKLRNSGIINMIDIRRGSSLIHESEDVYETIMRNFTYLAQKFGK